MIAVLQRVTNGSVSVDNLKLCSINQGLVIFLGVMKNDVIDDCEFLAKKISEFRIFNDDHNKMNHSIMDVGGSALVISQFTLCGDWKKGRRPSFVKAASPKKGRALYLDFIRKLKSKGITVKAGTFGAYMNIALTNDGPTTFVLDSHLA